MSHILIFLDVNLIKDYGPDEKGIKPLRSVYVKMIKKIFIGVVFFISYLTFVYLIFYSGGVGLWPVALSASIILLSFYLMMNELRVGKKKKYIDCARILGLGVDGACIQGKLDGAYVLYRGTPFSGGYTTLAHEYMFDCIVCISAKEIQLDEWLVRSEKEDNIPKPSIYIAEKAPTSQKWKKFKGLMDGLYTDYENGNLVELRDNPLRGELRFFRWKQRFLEERIPPKVAEFIGERKEFFRCRRTLIYPDYVRIFPAKSEMPQKPEKMIEIIKTAIELGKISKFGKT